MITAFTFIHLAPSLPDQLSRLWTGSAKTAEHCKTGVSAFAFLVFSRLPRETSQKTVRQGGENKPARGRASRALQWFRERHKLSVSTAMPRPVSPALPHPRCFTSRLLLLLLNAFHATLFFLEQAEFDDLVLRQGGDAVRCRPSQPLAGGRHKYDIYIYTYIYIRAVLGWEVHQSNLDLRQHSWNIQSNLVSTINIS